MSDTSTVYHPVFRDVTAQVASEEQREAHKAAGWRMTPIPDGDEGAAEGSPSTTAAEPKRRPKADTK